MTATLPNAVAAERRLPMVRNADARMARADGIRGSTGMDYDAIAMIIMVGAGFIGGMLNAVAGGGTGIVYYG